MNTNVEVLPYRTDADDLVRLLEARARGWELDQIRALNFSAKTFEGTVHTARLLGLLSVGEALTERGRRFALADADERREMLRQAIQAFEPYGLLLEAIFSSGPPQNTDMNWVERWWATNGYGSSRSNRAEGATVFGRLAEQVGLGVYVQGRRGHPTRIEWQSSLQPLGRSVSAVSPGSGPAPLEPSPPPGTNPVRAAPPAAAEPDLPQATGSEGPYSTLTVRLAPGRVVRMSVPSTLTAAEKARLLSLLDLLITVEGAV